MAHAKETRTAARGAYIHEAQPLEAIAARLDVSVGTLSRWKRDALESGDDWDKARAAARLAGKGADAVAIAVLEQFLMMFQSTLDELNAGEIPPLAKAEALGRLSDAYTKTTAAASRGSPKLSKLAVAMEVLQMLAEYIRSNDPQLVAGFIKVLEPFGAELARAYG